MMYNALRCVMVCSVLCSVVGIGDVHTSIAAVAQLAGAEHRVVDVLREYLSTQDTRLDVIRR